MGGGFLQIAAETAQRSIYNFCRLWQTFGERKEYDAAVRVDEVKDIRDKAAAMMAYATQARDTDLMMWATEVKMRAERRAGQMLLEMKAAGERAEKGEPVTQQMSRGVTSAPTLSDLGVTRMQSSRWQKSAKMPEEKFESAIETKKVKAADLLGEKSTIATLHTGDEESYTPPKYLDSARLVMGGIDLDPASNDMAQETVQASIYYSTSAAHRCEKSDRQVAAALGVSDKTVGAARRDMEASAEIPHHDTVVGKDGVTQPRTKKPPKTVYVSQEIAEKAKKLPEERRAAVLLGAALRDAASETLRKTKAGCRNINATRCFNWRPHGDSNPGRRRERAVS